MSGGKTGTVQRLQEYSIPLIAGVVVAMVMANVAPGTYEKLIHTPVYAIGSAFTSTEDLSSTSHLDAHTESPSRHAVAASVVHGTEPQDHSAVHLDNHAVSAHGHGGWGHYFTLHFLINDIFMVFFFGIAAKEITEACLPGGPLNPPSKAVNPLLGTLGGVLGPIATFLAANSIFGETTWYRGWGIPTATDIALAWLVARFVFGNGHPAIKFLLLLAVADDAIGLGIIAFAYPDPDQATQWLNTAWIIPGVALAYGLRRFNVQHWWIYVLIGGAFTWWGLFSAHLHPALALVFIVPFLPGPKRDLGLFVEEDRDDASVHGTHHVHSPLENFEHTLKLSVDLGLFFFAFANAGVPLSGISNLSWIVLASLLIGKTVGVTLFSFVGDRLGFKLPDGMEFRHLVVTGVTAGLGLTVALFVSAQAFTDPATQGAAKMGALFSGGVAAASFALGWALNVRNRETTFSLQQVLFWKRSPAR
ncbi:MAG: Na+/H+ antiporter NhaA [Pirellulaceae bacterium]